MRFLSSPVSSSTVEETIEAVLALKLKKQVNPEFVKEFANFATCIPEEWLVDWTKVAERDGGDFPMRDGQGEREMLQICPIIGGQDYYPGHRWLSS